MGIAHNADTKEASGWLQRMATFWLGSPLNMSPLPKIVLASASPARKLLLQNIGINPLIQVSNVDEPAAELENGWITPTEIAQGLAKLKAQDVANGLIGESIVIGCDSVMEFAGRPYGKPKDAAEAAQRLREMSGGSGFLHTGHSVALVTANDTRWAHALCTTEVFFHELNDAEIHSYIATGEPLKVAGSFTIDSLGGPFIKSINGDAANVVGLSVQTLRALFFELGIGWDKVLSQVTAK
jgi:septum formation protein